MVGDAFCFVREFGFEFAGIYARVCPVSWTPWWGGSRPIATIADGRAADTGGIPDEFACYLPSDLAKRLTGGMVVAHVAGEMW